MDKIVSVKVSAGAKTEKVEEIEPGVFKIRVGAPPEKGKANQRVAELLAKHFNIPISRVFLKSGAVSREKLFLIS
jgi:uncharacterized protein (TIGR00251 family)